MSDDKRDEEREEPSFTVKDRRRFDSDGEIIEGEEVKAAEPDRSDVEPREDGAVPTAEMPQMDFVTFTISLARSAMMHLEGQELPDGSRHKDVEMARQSIDILAMLKEKTQGNLSQEEAKLLEQVLYELRMVFVSAAGV